MADAHPFATPQQTLQPRQQDGKLEGFGKIVVGTGGESLEHVLGPPPGRQHQHRNEILRGPQLGGHGKAIFARKHHIEHDSIELLALVSFLLPRSAFAVFLMTEQQLDRALAIAGNFDAVPFGFEIETQPLSQVCFIFDDEHAAHARFSRTALSRAGFSTAPFSWEGFRGNSTTTVVPCPSPRLSANARPPCFLAMARTMKRPRPVPLICASERLETR